MEKKIKNLMIIILSMLILLGIISVVYINNDNSELKKIKSDKELSKMYEGDNSIIKNTVLNIFTMPFSIGNWRHRYYNYEYDYNPRFNNVYSTSDSEGIFTVPTGNYNQLYTKSSSSSVLNSLKSSSRNYSTTNIQVENVDEADVTKTDGNYIYSISGDNVIITNVMNPKDIKKITTIQSTDSSIPEDLILYKNQLIVIATINKKSSYSNYNSNTIVKIYDIKQKNKPILLKKYELCEPYYTSRCINNELYVIASGNLRKENDEIVTYYEENDIKKEIGLDNIKYLKDVKTNKQTLISIVDLNNTKKDINVSSYLIDISNAYVSENSIYLLDEKYDYGDYGISIKSLFGIKGAIGPFLYENDDDSGYKTEIYKFDITTDGHVTYNTKTKIRGKTINQYSLDESNGHLRVALYDSDGSRVVVFNEKLQKIGISKYVAKGETMYSSRFMNNKVYLVTYRTTDPLFVIDLSNEEQPKVLGELKIPGYSTYLHPYDENHLIGIGMETEEVVNKNASGKVMSTTSRIIGMKMALFDVSDVNKPKQISSTVIGDSRTTSAILTNPKALLFSKEKNLIAIPVNNYSEDFKIDSSSDSYSSMVSSYTNYNKQYIAEGYFVYNIDIRNGFALKGVITHEASTQNKKSSYYKSSKLLRGLYIDNNLYTISENAIKVNELKNLQLIDELKIK